MGWTSFSCPSAAIAGDLASGHLFQRPAVRTAEVALQRDFISEPQAVTASPLVPIRVEPQLLDLSPAARAKEVIQHRLAA